MVNLEKTKVFIIGCDELFAESIRNILEEKQFTVAISQNVKNAMLVASAQIFDLVIISWDNDEMSGTEVLKTLRKDRRYNDVPALFALNPTQSPELVEHIDDGVYDFVKLPVYGPELITRVDNLLKVREFYKQIIREKKELKEELTRYDEEIVQYKHEVELPFFMMLENIRNLKLPKEIGEQARNIVGSVEKAAELLNQLHVSSNIGLSRNGNSGSNGNGNGNDFTIDEILNCIIKLIQPHLDEQKCKVTVLKRENIPADLLRGDMTRLKYILLYYFASILSQVKNSILAIDVNTDLNTDNPQIGFRIICPDSGIYCYELKNDPKRSFLNNSSYSFSYIENYVRKMGGSASVDSLESSVAYRFMIPVQRVSDEVKQVERSVPSVKSKILVVDDNPFNQKILSMLLRKLNMEFDLATNGLKAVELFKSNTYTCILMDIFMPEMDGLEAAREIRNMEREMGTYTKIIAISASTSDHMMKVCLEAGMNDYLIKPFTIEILQEKLEELEVNV